MQRQLIRARTYVSSATNSLYRFMYTWTVTENKEYVNGTCAGCRYSPSGREEVLWEGRE